MSFQELFKSKSGRRNAGQDEEEVRKEQIEEVFTVGKKNIGSRNIVFVKKEANECFLRGYLTIALRCT